MEKVCPVTQFRFGEGGGGGGDAIGGGSANREPESYIVHFCEIFGVKSLKSLIFV